jgi:archaellum component FlaG (FlaF/FlaG flagellin family)
MRRALIIVFVIAVVLAAFVAGGYAATKSYQFTGVVKAADQGSLTVEKSAKETWQFEVTKDTKGSPKVGDKVTVYYKMVATEIEAKPATATATAATAKKK